MTYIVDRCYGRYLITLSRDLPDEGDAAEGSTAETLWEFQRKALLNVIDDHLQAGRLRTCGIDESRSNTLTIDVEAVSGDEDMLAGAIDAISTGMVTLADMYPDDVTIEI